MAAYLRALHGLLDEDIEWLAPGHGFLVARPHEVVRALVRSLLEPEGYAVHEAPDALHRTHCCE